MMTFGEPRQVVCDRLGFATADSSDVQRSQSLMNWGDYARAKREWLVWAAASRRVRSVRAGWSGRPPSWPAPVNGPWKPTPYSALQRVPQFHQASNRRRSPEARAGRPVEAGASEEQTKPLL